MLKRLPGLLILLAVVYFVATQAGPWIDRLRGTPRSTEISDDDGGASLCVDRAYAANESLGDTVREFGYGSVQVDLWSEAMWQVESDINEAYDDCTCPTEACRLAGRALEEMREQIAQLDSLVRGTATGYANPATRQERILELLERAESSV